MSYSDTTFEELVDWVEETRPHSPRLNIEANSILVRLVQLHHRQQQIAAMSGTPLTLGLYGNSVASKNHLLKMLASEGRDEIFVQLGENTLNYLRQINPDNCRSAIAIRFSNTPHPVAENFPLLLTLFSERDLAERLIRQYHTSVQPHIVPSFAIATIVSELQMCRQPKPVPGIVRQQMSAIIQCYHQYIARQNQLDDALVYQMVELAPWLNLTERGKLLSSLWGEHTILTSQWQQQAQRLHHLGNVTQLLAPASLVIDNLLLPNKGFLYPSSEEVREYNTDVIVCPLHQNKKLARLNIALQDLASICAEINFTLNHTTSLNNVDIIDVPNGNLHYYQERLQPDMLIICNDAVDNQNLLPIAKMLTNWVEKTQSAVHSALPSLVWAKTPFDRDNHIDNAVQRFITCSGKRWGSLQALNQRENSYLSDWLTAAVGQDSREERLESLQHDLDEQIESLFQRYQSVPTTSRRQHTEILIRAIQSQASRHGELIDRLMLSRYLIHQCWLQHHQQQIKQPAGLMLNMNLFDDTDIPTTPAIDNFAMQVFSLWVNHLYRLSLQSTAFSGLPQTEFLSLCEILIETAWRLGLPQRLESAQTTHNNDSELAVTHASNVLSEFIMWLGYNEVVAEHRPTSRINKDAPIFAPPPQTDANIRLTRLSDDLTQGNARYIYDWLIALLTRATENSECDSADGLDKEQRSRLLKVLGI